MAEHLIDSIPAWESREFGNGPASSAHTIGILTGEGVGPEIIPVCVDLLHTIQHVTGEQLNVDHGGIIGKQSLEMNGSALSEEVIAWAETVFSSGGALLCGPAGGRFVYDLRSRFDLYCKFTPIQPQPELSDCSILNPSRLANTDMVLVRENSGGDYYGTGHREQDTNGGDRISYSFTYYAYEVERIIRVAANLAGMRSGRLCLVIKTDGLPDISRLWSDIFLDVTRSGSLETEVIEIDNAVYQIVASPQRFDVIVSPNMFGDILADTASLLLGSRGLSYSGNFGAAGIATYQTGHGAAYDIAGQNCANPIGQIFSVAMMLRESFGMDDIADVIICSTSEILQEGYRTMDIGTDMHTILSTPDMGRVINERLEKNLTQLLPRQTAAAR